MFGCLLSIISNGRDAQTTHVVKEVKLYPCAPQLSLCFVNTRVNFAQGTSSLEMLSGGSKSLQCDLCSLSVRHSAYKETEIPTSQSMSEQAL